MPKPIAPARFECGTGARDQALDHLYRSLMRFLSLLDADSRRYVGRSALAMETGVWWLEQTDSPTTTVPRDLHHIACTRDDGDHGT